MFTVDGYEAWEVIHGSFNMELFNSFIKNHVLPRMNAFPGPRSVLVMDNCRIHRNEVLNHGLELTVDIEGDVWGCRSGSRIFTAIFTRFEPDRRNICTAQSLDKKETNGRLKGFRIMVTSCLWSWRSCMPMWRSIFGEVNMVTQWQGMAMTWRTIMKMIMNEF